MVRNEEIGFGGVRPSQPIYMVGGLINLTFNHLTSSGTLDLGYFAQCIERAKGSWKIGDKFKSLPIMNWDFVALKCAYCHAHEYI